MKFTKSGRALVLSALSVGVILGVTSCVQSYSVGYLYVTGTVTAQTSSNGIISGFKIDHNTGKLNPINGLPVSSGGANPGRAVLLNGSAFLYVLNRGVTASGSLDCTTADPCQGSNITVFAVGGNGVLTPQPEQFYSQGLNPFRIYADPSGQYILVVDRDAPSNATCSLALGPAATTCGDVTIFAVNQNTGRLTLVVNAQVTSASGQALTYFPIPANAIDAALIGSSFITLFGTPATGDSVFPYSYNGGPGQLTVSQNTTQPLTGEPVSGANPSGYVLHANAIVPNGATVYVLDNEPLTTSFNGGATTTYQSQIIPYTVGSSGALQAQPVGILPDDATLANPIWVLNASTTTAHYLYVANDGNNTSGTNLPGSGIAGYTVVTTQSAQYSFIAGEPFGLGSGPQCLVEDPSNQFIYSANFNDSTVSLNVIDPNSGVLTKPRVAASYALQGPAAWCLVDGRTY
jgi:6-phosphogluconolactonase (cycloisomerase 2 family)